MEWIHWKIEFTNHKGAQQQLQAMLRGNSDLKKGHNIKIREEGEVFHIVLHPDRISEETKRALGIKS